MSNFISASKRLSKRLAVAFTVHVFQVIFALIIVIIAVNTFIMHYLEDISFMESVYVSVTSITTVGQTNFIPKKIFGKIIMMVFTFLGTGLFLCLFAGLAQFIVLGEQSEGGN